MKKIKLILAVIFILLAVLSVSAQHQVGIVTGLNLASASFDPEFPEVDLKNRTFAVFGGVFDLHLSENVALSFMPMYLQKGAKSEALDGQELFVTNTTVSYIEIPALVKISFGETTTRPYLVAGPSLGILLSAEYSDIDVGKVDIDDFLSGTDFSFTFGGGVNFAMENLSFFLEGRYALGLSNIDDGFAEIGLETEISTDIKTKGFQIMGGITFPLGAQ